MPTRLPPVRGAAAQGVAGAEAAVGRAGLGDTGSGRWGPPPSAFHHQQQHAHRDAQRCDHRPPHTHQTPRTLRSRYDRAAISAVPSPPGAGCGPR
jgi:hypothetical protein